MGNGESVPDEIESPDASDQVHMAAYGNHIEKLKQMKASKENLFVRDGRNRTALHYAAGRGAAAVLGVSVGATRRKGLDRCDGFEAVDSVGLCLYRSKSKFTNKEQSVRRAKLLLSAGCDLSLLQSKGSEHKSLGFMPLDTIATDGRTLVHWAAKSGQVKLLKHLFNKLEIDPVYMKMQDRRGWTPLMCASLCTADTVRETLSFLLNF